MLFCRALFMSGSLRYVFWKLAIPALLLLILYGRVDRMQVWLLLGVGIGWRWVKLWHEHRQVAMKDEDWEALTQGLEREQALHQGATDEDENLAPNPVTAKQQVAALQLLYRPPRSGPVLMIEGLALPAFLLGLPVLLLMAESDFFTFRRSFGWGDLLVILGCAVLFYLPHLPFVRRETSMLTKAWWLAPLFLVPAAMAVMVKEKHPYWNVFHPEHRRLAAEKVLSLTDWIMAADHAGWVFAYAEELAEKGRIPSAREFCEKGLRMEPGSARGNGLMARLGGTQISVGTDPDAFAPYLPDGTLIPRARRCRVETAHDTGSVFTLLLLPVGEVPDQDLDFVAEVLRLETGIPTKVYEKSLPLPEATRSPGLLAEKQWEIGSLLKSVLPEVDGRRMRGPLKILVITSGDLYSQTANFVFAWSYAWGGVVSRARFSLEGQPWLTRHRLAKQCYGTLIKSFDIMPSADPRCVTSYPNGLPAFDAKGNRPLPEVRRQFLEKVAVLNRTTSPPQ